MTRILWFGMFCLTVVALLATNRAALAATGSSSFTGDGNWGNPAQGHYAQGFALATNATAFAAPINGTADLTQFQFYKSGAPDATNVQLAIVNNYFLTLDNTNSFSSSDPAVVGLSSNTLNVTSANYAVGAPIVFTFNNLAMTYGHGTYDSQGYGVFEGPDYAAICVQNNGGTLTPVLTPTIEVNYAQVNMPYDGTPSDANWPNPYLPTHDYGYRRDYNDGTNQHFGDYFKAASNYISGGFFQTFGPWYGDVDFSATFTYTPLKGDFNGDGHFNAADIAAMEQALTNTGTFESSNGLSASDLVALGDFNGDHAVTNADLQGMLIALKNGQGSSSAVPEPASIALASLAGIALLVVGHSRGARAAAIRRRKSV